MPYVPPKGPGIIPRKKVTGRIPRTRHVKADASLPNVDPASSRGESSEQGLANQLSTVQISSPENKPQDLSTQDDSARSSFDSQAPSTHSRKTTATSSMSIPSLIDGATTTPSSASLDSPKHPDTALEQVIDEHEIGQGSIPKSASASSISSPGGTSLPSGALTPMTDATSLGGLDENAQRLANYKEGIYAYTRNLYLQAQQSIQRKAAIDSLPQFGLNKSGAEKKASKRATARRLSSFT